MGWDHEAIKRSTMGSRQLKGQSEEAVSPKSQRHREEFGITEMRPLLEEVLQEEREGGNTGFLLSSTL